MDKEIRSIKNKMDKMLSQLAKEDKKRDPACDLGKKMIKKKGRK